MIRESFSQHYTGSDEGFNPRGKEPGRLENFSDAAFALAITLLLISTSPPTNFTQIKRFVYDLLPFLLCIAALVAIWTQHFVFFYRYGIRNGRIIFLNTLFLVLVLFYVYPLKFLARLVLVPFAQVTGNDSLLKELSATINWSTDIGKLMIIYGVGYGCIFLILALMYRYALKNSEALNLNELEKFDTRASMQTNLIMTAIPFVSVIVAAIFIDHWLAGMLGGFTYMLFPIVMPMFGARVGRKRKKLIASLNHVEPAPSIQDHKEEPTAIQQ
jgi:uncharacterized membrane protein